MKRKDEIIITCTKTKLRKLFLLNYFFREKITFVFSTLAIY